MSYSADVTKDTARPGLQHMMEQLGGRKVFDTISAPLVRLFQRHLRALPHNIHGWPPVNFYPDAARATSAQFEVDGTVISIAQQGIRQRYFGGTISAVNKRALTIPISPDSYGKKASDFEGEGMFLMQTPKGAYLVRYNDSGLRKTGQSKAASVRSKSTFNFLFKLVPSVNQAANPDIIPSDDEIYNTIAEELKKELAKN